MRTLRITAAIIAATLIGCTPVEISDTATPPELDAPVMEAPATESEKHSASLPDASESATDTPDALEHDPCSEAALGGPWPVWLGRDWSEVNELGTYDAAELISVTVTFCSDGGHVDVTDPEGNVYGAAHQGREWLFLLLPDQRATISGGKYALSSEAFAY